MPRLVPDGPQDRVAGSTPTRRFLEFDSARISTCARSWPVSSAAPRPDSGENRTRGLFPREAAEFADARLSSLRDPLQRSGIGRGAPVRSATPHLDERVHRGRPRIAGSLFAEDRPTVCQKGPYGSSRLSRGMSMCSSANPAPTSPQQRIVVNGAAATRERSRGRRTHQDLARIVLLPRARVRIRPSNDQPSSSCIQERVRHLLAQGTATRWSSRLVGRIR